jgi:hypothetical protein
VLERVLARHGLTFEEQLTLRTAATAETPPTPDEPAGQVEGFLKAGPAVVRAALDGLRSRGLLAAEGEGLRATDAGRELIAATGAEPAPASARIWGGIPADDLAAAGRVLALVTGRADAEFARPA